MAESLKENIDKAYYYQLKHKEAEMQELQAKFNPHFSTIRWMCSAPAATKTGMMKRQN